MTRNQKHVTSTLGKSRIIVGSIILAAVAYGSLCAIAPVALLLVPVTCMVAFVLFGNQRYVLFALLLVRSLSDTALIPEAAGFALNIGIAAGIIVLSVRCISAVGKTSILLILYTGIFTVVGLLVLGVQPSMLSDSLRVLTLVAFAVCAGFVAAQSSTAELLSRAIWVSTPAVVLIALAYLFKVPGMYSMETGRAFGTMAHPVAAGGFLGLVGILAVYALLVFRQARYLGVLGVVILALLGTTSLGGIATLGAGITVLMLLLKRSVRHRYTLMLTAGAAGLLGFFLSGNGLTERVAQLSQTQSFADASSGTTTNSLDWRFRNWSALLQFWEERPLFGWGLGSTSDVIRPIGELPHSAPVRILVESGIVGFSLGLLLLSGAVYRIWVTRQNPDAGNIAALMSATLATVFVNSLSSNTLDYVPMLLLFLVAWSVGRGSRLEPKGLVDIARASAEDAGGLRLSLR